MTFFTTVFIYYVGIYFFMLSLDFWNNNILKIAHVISTRSG